MRVSEPAAATFSCETKLGSQNRYARLLFIATLLPWLTPLHAQSMLTGPGGQVRLVGGDLAVLTTQDERREISCTVTPDKPVVGFDLRFHSSYSVAIPLKELAGNENSLTILFRVTPVTPGKNVDLSGADQTADATYFIQHYTVPEVAEDASGDAVLGGNIDLGEGSYHVDWLLRDRMQRVCSHYWDINAVLGGKDKEMTLDMTPETVAESSAEQFGEEPAATRASQTPLKIKVLVNFAPQNALASTMRPQDTSALVSILRRLSRAPELGKFSVVAFNIQEQRVLYRQESGEQIDFPALGEALHAIKLGTVDASKLQRKHGDTEFLTELIQREMTSEDHPDALVFAGPKIMLDASVPEETLKPLSGVDYPVFYMNYTLNPQAVPWKDSISRAIKTFRGTEYTITRPRDMWVSLSEMVSRIVKSSYGRSQLKAAQ